ncbi:MAG TPA: amino acid adenylation domain-containing protein, partial [Pirellulales bacterium]
LRDEVTNDLSFRELVRRVRQTVQDALSRQDVPLERLVQEVKPRRDPSRHPLFQAVFVLQAELTELRKELPGVVMSPFKQRNEETKFDLQMSANPTLDGFRLTLGYNRDLFDGDSIERITDHMRVFLARALASPDVPLGEISLLEDGERTELVVRRNQTQKAFDGPGCVHQLFERQVALRPDASAVEHDDRKVTYRELNTLADRIAARLRVEGVTTDRPVGVILERSIEMVAAFLGVLKSGGAYLPLDPLLPASRLELHLTDAAPTVVLANRRTAGRLASLPSSPRVLLVEDLLGDEAAPLDPAFAESATPGAPSDMAYILYTSGSTGRPKGVAVEHRSVVNYIHAASEVYKLTSSDRVLQFASSAHDAHVEEIYPCLAAGATLVLRTDEMLDSYQDFLVGCQTTGVSVVSLPTAYWHELTAAIVDHGLRRLPSAMRLVILGGERAWSERVSQWFDQIGDRVALVNTYGPTEATVIATACRVVDPRDPEGGVRRVPIGAPIANVRTYVLDEAQRPVPIGVPGELYIGGDCLARGYLGRPDLTAERFVPDPFSDVPGARMYRTGDLVRWLPDGLLDFLGRTDGQVKIRGFRIEPGEVEAALSAHPGVAQAAVVALPDGDEFRLVGYVATHDANGPAPLELRRYLEGQLPHYLVPSVICRLPSLPTNAAGKIDRAALPAPEAAAEGREIAEAPQSPEEEQIAAVFCETLRVERVGRHENFFDLGGHSLLAVQLLSKLRTRLNVELRLNDLLMGPTVAQIAETIKNPHADSRSLHPALGALTGDDSPNEKPSSDASKTPGATKAAAPAGNANNVGRMLFGAPAPEPVVTLRPGDRWRPPIVLWPGLGGRVEGFKQLADWLAPGHPIVGIQARGLDGIEAPHRTMGESIEWGLQALAEAGYESPLVVGGMSMGGLNALEMSRRLRATGRPPQLTLLLDTQLPMGSGFTGDMPSVGDDEVFGRLAKWLNLDVAPLLSVAEGDRWSSLLKRGQAAGVIPAEVTLEQLKGLGAVCRCQLEGLASYELQSDPGAVLLIQAVQDKHGQTSQTGAVAVAKWQKIFPNFSVYRVPTYHVGVLQPPHVKAIARQVNVILQTAPSGVAGREGATS